ncbi:hypothetical protein AVEN_77055-1 [Araneus ventricosus]|uniref:Uncharacterized protein n=1 Tax=Araneus ventricosus TaxID=182803 RepID=A0A4Y2G5W5_ARAVE|nr:hypothetical protein AVEN_77055-1 [Araneus ventricosus]
MMNISGITSGIRYYSVILEPRWFCGGVSVSRPEGGGLEIRPHRRSSVHAKPYTCLDLMLSYRYGYEVKRLRCGSDLNCEFHKKIAPVLL